MLSNDYLQRLHAEMFDEVEIDERSDLPAAPTEPIFVAGEPVHLVTQVEGAPSNTPATVVWYGTKDQPVREKTNWTRGNEKAPSFTAPNTSDWTK